MTNTSELKRKCKQYREMLKKAATELDMINNAFTGRYDKEGKSKVVIEIETLLKKRKF